MEQNSPTPVPTPPTAPQLQPSVPIDNTEVKTSALYDQGFNKKTMFFQYFFVRVWPPMKRTIEETAYFLFKLFRSLIKFALVQMGIRSGA
jgi:hypothetical protein